MNTNDVGEVMLDKRLLREIKSFKSYFIIGTAASIVAVLLTIFQGLLLSEIIAEVFLKKRLLKDVLNSLILLVLLLFLRATVNFFSEYYSRKCTIKIKGNLRRKLIDAFIDIGPIKLRNEKAGKLSALGEEGIEAFDAYISEFIPQMILVTVTVPMLLFIVSRKDLLSGLIMLFTAPLIPIYMILIGKLADYFNKRQWKSLQKMSGHFLDVLKGLSTLRLFGKSKTQTQVILKVSEGFRSSTMGILKISFLSALVLELVATLSTAILSVTLGVRLLYGRMAFEQAFFILLMAPEYYQPLRQLGAKFHAAMGAKAAGDSIFPFLEEFKDKPTSIGEIPFSSSDRIYIEISGLSYSYDNETDVLDDINMNINKNKKIAFVGPSGSGKSTLMAILMGFLKDYKGSVRVNGMELRELDVVKWTVNFAYVSQYPKLFKGTIMDNIKLSKPEASTEEVLEVTRLFGIDLFVSNMPNGYDTVIGEGGVWLSGGQIQLIAIARAYLKNTNIIFLDEPTSSLDIETENALIRALDIISKDKTVITIAHRIPTIMKSDAIYVFEKGRIVEAGKHDELVGIEGVYNKLLAAWGGQV